MLRYSLAGLLLLVTVAAAGSLALARPSVWSAEASWAATLLVLLLAAVAAVYSCRPWRAFAGGAAIAGLGYLIVPQIADREVQIAIVPVVLLYEEIHGPEPLEPATRTVAEWMRQPRRPAKDSPPEDNYVEYQKYQDRREHFVAVGQCLIVLLVAFLGGVAAGICRSRKSVEQGMITSLYGQRN